VGKRIKFEDSVKIVEAINDGSLDKVETYKFKSFDFDVPVAVEGINPNLMYPEKNWHSSVEYEETLTALVVEFA
jgi:phosphoenolpyruvate carboxykinase (ATP)